MKLNQVLVVYKQATGNRQHLATLNELYEILKAKGISFSMISSRHLKNVVMADLVITVGGDGTVLAASHYVHDTPILGIKSFGKKSVGYFCAATRKTMRAYLKDIISDKRKPIKLHRLNVAVGKQKLEELVLNDVLFSNIIPASTSRYRLIIGNRSEEQKSSGVWVSTSAGSTAAICAAGGKVLPLTSDKVEYVVREPYVGVKRYKLKKGVVPSRTVVKIVSQMSDGTVFIDGGSTQYPAPAGSIVSITGAKRPLRMYWR